MTNPSDISLALAAVFGLLHVIFTLRVGNYRFKSKISLGDGGDHELRQIFDALRREVQPLDADEDVASILGPPR